MATISDVLLPPKQRLSVDEVRNNLDLGGSDRRSKVSGFLIMLVLSGLIAAMGVLADSTATVIGAMIIAPLGTPIQGIALGIVTGDTGLLRRSLGWVGTGIVVVILIGMTTAALMPGTLDLSQNSQVIGRTSPGLLDLFVALATGIAGAFAIARRDLGNALPGVAIAISLVPPLAVVGATAGQGMWIASAGAALLFLSNVMSLVIAGSLVFTLAGYVSDPDDSARVNRRRAYTTVAVLLLVILIPIGGNTLLGVFTAQWTDQIKASATEWLKPVNGGVVDSVTWKGQVAVVDVTSPDGKIPDTASLAADLVDKVPKFIAIQVDVVVGSEHKVPR